MNRAKEKERESESEKARKINHKVYNKFKEKKYIMILKKKKRCTVGTNTDLKWKINYFVYVFN